MIITRLLWKEAREQFWPTVACCTILLSLVLIGSKGQTLLPWVVDIALVVGTTIMPIFIAAGTVAGERSRKTLWTLGVQPLRSTTILWAKVLVGMAACIVPILMVGSVAWMLGAGHELMESQALHIFVTASWGLSNYLVAMITWGCVGAAMMFLWTLAWGVRQPSEWRVGLVGLGILGGGCIWTTLTLEGWSFEGMLFFKLYLLGPLAPLQMMRDHYLERDLYWAIAILPIVAALLLAWTAHRLNILLAQGGSFTLNRRMNLKSTTLRARRSPWRATIWKEWRELRIGMLIFSAVLFALGLAQAAQEAGYLWTRWDTITTWPGYMPNMWIGYFAGGFVEGATSSLSQIGVVWAVIMGVQISRDLDMGLLQFWRSRPMNARRWFGMKYLIGLSAVVGLIVAVLGTSWFINGLVSLHFWSRTFDEWWQFPVVYYFWHDLHLAAANSALCGLAYTVAMLWTGWLRNAVYGAILSVGTILLLVAVPFIVPELSWIGAPWGALYDDEYGHVTNFAYAGIIGVAVPITLAMILLIWFTTRLKRAPAKS